MINNQKDKKVIDINSKRINHPVVDTQSITALLKKIANGQTSKRLEDRRLKQISSELDLIINSFNETYKELISNEIRIFNLSIAANSVYERDQMVDNIYKTVIQEVQESIC